MAIGGISCTEKTALLHSALVFWINSLQISRFKHELLLTLRSKLYALSFFRLVDNNDLKLSPNKLAPKTSDEIAELYFSGNLCPNGCKSQ